MKFFNRKNVQERQTKNSSFTLTGSRSEFFNFLGLDEDEMDGEITYNVCLKVLSETMGKMPFKFEQKTEQGVKMAQMTNIADLLINAPNEFMTPTVFWTAVERNRIHYGNAYVYMHAENKIAKGKVAGAEITSLWIMPSQNVDIVINNGIFNEHDGHLIYLYTDEYTGESYRFTEKDVLHFKSSHTFDGIKGVPMREIIKSTLNGSMKSQGYMNKMYSNGLTGAGFFEVDQDIDLNEESAEAIANKLKEKLTGAKNIGNLTAIPQGFKYVPLTTKNTDAQFFELRKYSALQIASCFGVKPNQLNDYEKSSYSSSEQQQLAFLVETMLSTIKQYEEEINLKLLSKDERLQGYRFRLNNNVLLRVDALTQSNILTSYVANGVYNVNEARDMLNLPHVEGGDINFCNGTNYPLRDLGKQYEKGGETSEQESELQPK